MFFLTFCEAALEHFSINLRSNRETSPVLLPTNTTNTISKIRMSIVSQEPTLASIPESPTRGPGPPVMNELEIRNM